MGKQDIRIVPTEDRFGATVEGIDLDRDLTAAEVARLRDALEDHLVLVAREQHVSDERIIAYCERFGVCMRPSKNPYGLTFHETLGDKMNVISNVVENGRPIGNLGAAELAWHADVTFEEPVPIYGCLYAVAAPAHGGDTCFADMYAACRDLPDDLRRAAAGRIAIHDAAHNSAGLLRKGYEEVTDPRDTPGARHPLIRRNPRTGRMGLYLGRRGHQYVIGLNVQDSDDLLDALWAHATRPEYTMRWQWRTGDALLWNNDVTLHRRDAFDPTARRILRNVLIQAFP
ncbi:MAG: TauD/TfdA dioxygenase family protein [Alphaproteobacteria bacterium]